MSYDPREDKLPKWARDHIAALRRRTEDAEKQAAEVRFATDPDGSDAVLHPHADIPVGLGKAARVQFRVGQDLQAYLDVRVQDGALIVHGGRVISVEPYSGNVVHVRIRDGW